MIDANGEVYLIDFGLAINLHNGQSLNLHSVTQFVAPEVYDTSIGEPHG